MDRWFFLSLMRDYFTQVPGTLIWLLIGVWIWVLVAAKAVILMDITTRAAVATITSFFMVFLLLGEIVNLPIKSMWCAKSITYRIYSCLIG
jgi:hypothetical protein